METINYKVSFINQINSVSELFETNDSFAFANVLRNIKNNSFKILKIVIE